MQQKSWVWLLATVRRNKEQSLEAPPKLVPSFLGNQEPFLLFLSKGLLTFPIFFLFFLISLCLTDSAWFLYVHRYFKIFFIFYAYEFCCCYKWNAFYPHLIFWCINNILTLQKIWKIAKKYKEEKKKSYPNIRNKLLLICSFSMYQHNMAHICLPHAFKKLSMLV